MSFNLEDAGYWNSPEQCDAANEIVTLREQVATLTKDAERYRWHVRLWAEAHGMPEEAVIEELDLAIAKAMQEDKL